MLQAVSRRRGRGSNLKKGKPEVGASREISGGSAEEGEETETGQLDLLALMDKALAHRYRAEALTIKGNSLVAAFELTRAWELLEGASPLAEEPSLQLRVLFQDTKQQVLAGRAHTYFVLAERAQKGGQDELVEQFRKRQVTDGLRLKDLDPAWSDGYLQAARGFHLLGKETSATELLSQAEEECEHGAGVVVRSGRFLI